MGVRIFLFLQCAFEPPHDKTNKNGMCAQWRLRSEWASVQSDHESSLCAQWVAKDPSWSESSLGAHAILLVLSWGGSFYLCLETCEIRHAAFFGGTICLSERLAKHDVNSHRSNNDNILLKWEAALQSILNLEIFWQFLGLSCVQEFCNLQ